MTTPNEVQPLPCPFCGHAGLEFAEGSTFRWIVASCAGCGASKGETRIQTMGQGTKDEWMRKARDDATNEWNTRATPPAPEGWAEAVAGAQRTIAALHGHETWYVMNAAADGYCMSFASPEYLNPQRACEKWLGEQNPEWIARNGYHAVQSFEHTVVERMAIEAAQAVLSMDALMKGSRGLVQEKKNV